MTYPKFAYALQPFSDSSYYTLLSDTLSDERFDEITFVSAWILKSGLSKVANATASFRARGGHIVGFAGLSLGMATVDGLLEMLKQLDISYVVFDAAGRTIHPKMLLATGREHSRLFIGSQNLTSAGLTKNFEAGVEITWSHPIDTLPDELQEPVNFLKTLRESGSICRQLTYALIDEIERDPAINLLLESQIFARESRSGKKVKSTVFGSFAHPGAIELSELTESTSPREVVAKWTKTNLPRSDSQRPNGTSALGHIALTDSGNGIDVRTFFRHILFAGATWQPLPPDRETAQIPFEIAGIEGAPETATLSVDHTPRWDSRQNNRVTTLRWGPELNRILRTTTNIVGRTLEIQRLADGSFRLVVTRPHSTD